MENKALEKCQKGDGWMVTMNKMTKLPKWLQWLKKPQILILIFILIVAAFLRLYRIRDYIVFLGDEGRDA